MRWCSNIDCRLCACDLTLCDFCANCILDREIVGKRQKEIRNERIKENWD